ncbi:hypothetical protein [Clostridium sp. HBUAS56017]|uniref:hypothetical protein n=1 Tax=Clostridium sp. HBUAS56017 TaxID=2571128 RepID=UPI0011774B4A|nr:hypothetical protein [Clostridium sp. HBUAS56017]
MINIKAADWKLVRTLFGGKMVKGEKYRGFMIHRSIGDDTKDLWTVTITKGIGNGYALGEFRKKNTCKLLVDEVIKRIGRVELVIEDKEELNKIKSKFENM